MSYTMPKWVANKFDENVRDIYEAMGRHAAEKATLTPEQYEPMLRALVSEVAGLRILLVQDGISDDD